MTAEKRNTSTLLILLITTLTSFMTAFMGSALNIALPIIGKEFNASAVAVSWISTIYLISTAALLIPVGKLADTYGRTLFFKIGLTFFTIGTLLCGFALNEASILVYRTIQGIGSAMIFSCSTAILVSSYPPNQRGKAIGINTASVYTGLSSGPFIGGIITNYLSWHFIFHITTVIGCAILIITIFYLTSEWKETVHGKFDFAGTFLLIISIILTMSGISLLPKPVGLILIFCGTAAFYIFYKVELASQNPLLNFQLFKENRTFAFSNLAALINYSATFAVSFIISFYLQTVKMLNPRDAGTILITMPLVQALFSPLAGKLSDRIEPRIVSSTGMVILTFDLVVFCFLSLDLSFVIIFGNLAMLGFGFALFSSPNANAIMGSVEKKYYGIASSTLASMRVIGQMFSMGIVIVMFTVFMGNAKITIQNQHEFLQSTHAIFILFSILCVAGIFASLARGKIHR